MAKFEDTSVSLLNVKNAKITVYQYVSRELDGKSDRWRPAEKVRGNHRRADHNQVKRASNLIAIAIILNMNKAIFRN